MADTQRVVTQGIFDQAMKYVLDGVADFYIQTYTSTMKITGKTVKSFAKDGYEVLKKDDDGKGFLVMSGRKVNYVTYGQLIVVSK